MPSSKSISHHQACCIERGCGYSFHRIAAMPNLNLIAKKWADQHDNAFFVPLGLKHKMVTAGIVKSASRITPPDEVYCATSTGVLTRALQIAWPETKFTSVCVSRNMKAGELGRAKPISEALAFTASENDLQRNQQLALTAIANQFAEEMFEAQVDADSQKSIGVFLGRLLETGFSGVAKGLQKLGDE